MSTMSDLVSVLRHRDGAGTAVVVRRDGLLIDGATDAALDADRLAAFVPPMVLAASEMGVATGRGGFRPVLVRPDGKLVAPLDGLRRFRAQIASLV